ncbi:MAG: PQQ-binding-like beta-propeller repeat protein [Pirellulaceae bacterium]
MAVACGENRNSQPPRITGDMAARFVATHNRWTIPNAIISDFKSPPMTSHPFVYKFPLLFIFFTLFAPHAEAIEPTVAHEIKFSESDWPLWRGPRQDGVASTDQDPPVSWSETENVRWRSPLPGRGHSSPIVVGNRVYIASADHRREVQVVLAFDRDSGKQTWETVVHQGGFENKGNKINTKATLASSTLAYDGTRLFINFLNDSAVYTTALDMNGKIIWRTKLSDYVLHQGYGASPTIYKDLVIASADNKSGGSIVAMDRETGEIRWRHQRPEMPNYPSPIIVHAADRDQLIMTGCERVTSLNPLTGEVFWEVAGATTECVTSTVTNGRVVLTSGGYPDNHISAVAADGSGEIVWETTDRQYVPSMLMINNHVFAVHDAGVAACFDADSGKQKWKHRLGGTFSSSPVLVGDRIYVTNEEGETTIFKADDRQYQQIASNKLGHSVFATPAICGSQIFMRVTHTIDDQPQEFLYCLSK